MPETPDPFGFADVAAMQGLILAFLADRPADIGVKIAALHAAADLMTNAVQTSALAAFIQNSLHPPRK